MPDDHRDLLRDEFTRAAAAFDERTRGRFDDLGVVEFARFTGGSVAEVGAGTGVFLSLFDGVAELQIGIDITAEMLWRMRSERPRIVPMIGDGARLPLRSRSVDLVACAQMLHHVHQPLPVLHEMGRVAADAILIVDQVAPEHFEEAEVMHHLETLRDPSHAATRPPSAFRILVTAAGLDIVDEHIASSPQRMSMWMWPGEFPVERIAAVQTFLDEHAAATGMDFVHDGEEWAFTRRRMLILARRQ